MFPILLCMIVWSSALVSTTNVLRDVPPWPKLPGVAFGLNPDYGTAAVYFANKTHVEVARIEGSPAYKSMWQKTGTEETSAQAFRGAALTGRVLCPVFPSLNPALCSRQADLASTAALLRSLQAAVVSTLGTSFCFADVVLPDPHLAYQRDVVQDAIRSIGLRQAAGVADTAITAMYANGIGEALPWWAQQPAQVVLSIDYSASGLNALLLLEEQGVLEDLRKSYSPRHGAAQQAQATHADAVEDFLVAAIRPPFGEVSVAEMPGAIDRLVLHGDAVLEPGFLDTLRSVVGAALVERAHVLSPVYAGAVGMARISHDRLDAFDFVVEPAFGCQWRSRLYDTKREEL